VSGSCRAPEGSPCDNDADCTGNKCSTFYADNDDDDFGAESSGTRKICGVDAPAGDWVANNKDCCDSDAEANPDYDGNPRTFGATGCSTRPYDWNCDGEETKSYPFVDMGCTFYKTEETCPELNPVATSEIACGAMNAAGSACGWNGSTCQNATGVELDQGCY